MAEKNDNSGNKPARKASRSETGHNINVQHFKKLLIDIKGFGDSYQPSNQDIEIKQLHNVYSKIEAAMETLGQGISDFQTGENERRITFKSLKPKSTRIINALAAAGVSDLTLDDARLLVNKIQGIKTTKPSKEEEQETEEDNTISASQQSYNQLMDHFKDLKTLAVNQKKYDSKEEGLSKAALEEYDEQLIASNEHYLNVKRNLKKARIERDKLMYAENTGMLALTKLVKSQVLSMFDGKHPDYLKIKEISFKTFKPRKKKKKSTK